MQRSSPSSPLSSPPSIPSKPPSVHDWLTHSAYHVPKHRSPTDFALHANERTLGEHLPLLNHLLSSSPFHTQELTQYPSPSSLEERYAHFLDLSPDQVLLTAGGDEGLSRVFRAFLSPQSSLVLPTPTFPMLARFAQWCNAPIIEVEWIEGTYPVQAVLNHVQSDTRLVMIVSPNNPTGLTIEKEDFISLASHLAQEAPQCIIVFDGAYIEFAHEDLTSVVLDYPNCILIRTLSKAFGLAGLRMGFILGHPHLIQALRAVGLPYPVSGLALHVADHILHSTQDSPDSFNAMLNQVDQERLWLNAFFRTQGGHVSDSQGNFVFVNQVDALWWRDTLAGQGIQIRIWPDDPQLHNALRLTCPADPQGFKRLQNALLTSADPQALLFDVDGVLVDVSQSYRLAIIYTVQFFGIHISSSQIDEWKSKGNANNDWILTHQILLDSGVEVPFEEVQAKFEELYQSELWKKETLLGGSLAEVHHDLTLLSQHYPLALVTGRPRKDLNAFLDRFQLHSFFKTTVCMEDAPAKPHPRPIELALERLNQMNQKLDQPCIQRAWMIGDTPDDLQATRRCDQSTSFSLLGFGVCPSNSSLEDALWQAGCGRLLSSWREWCSFLIKQGQSEEI